jgi:dipeptidyl aminopeptidase/acylaminoacyl peptidase
MMAVHAGVAALLVVSGILTSAPGLAQQAATSAPRRHEILLAAFRDGEGRTFRLAIFAVQKQGFTLDKPRNITNHAGDDDHPCFLPDSSGLLFSSNRDGRQRDIYRYDIATKAVRRITDTPEDERSPTMTPDGRTFSAVRGAGQQLWRLNPTLALVDLESGSSEVVASNVGPSLHLRPGTGALTFVSSRRSGNSYIRELDPATRKVATYAPVVDGGGALAWTPSDRLLMASGAKLFVRENETDRWIENADLRKAGVTAITAISVSLDGKWIALVVAK